MELKVWVEGIQRIVCGVTDKTTCQDVVYALAHATGKTGRFTLIERWRNNERLLAPQEHPLKVLQKWGEYSQDVQFILQRSALDGKPNNSAPLSPPAQRSAKIDQLDPAKAQSTEPPAVWKPPPQPFRKPEAGSGVAARLSPDSGRGSDKTGSDTSNSYHENGAVHRPSHTNGLPPMMPRSTSSTSWQQQQQQQQQPPQYNNDYGFTKQQSLPSLRPPAYRAPPSLNRNSSPADPPPYREPPPPARYPIRPPHYSPPPTHRTTHLSRHPSRTSLATAAAASSAANHGRYGPSQPPAAAVQHGLPSYRQQQQMHFHGPPQQQKGYKGHPPTDYSELVNLVSAQQTTLHSQQAEIKHCDAEVDFLEGQVGLPPQHHPPAPTVYPDGGGGGYAPPPQPGSQLDLVLSEVRRLEEAANRNDDEMRQIAAERGPHNEFTNDHESDPGIRSEIMQLRHRLSGTDQELQKTNHTLRRLGDEMRSMSLEKSRQREVELAQEVERLQIEIKALQKNSEEAANVNQQLSKEVKDVEDQISERKAEVEKLIQEMREANMESLAISPPEESKQFLDGPPKQPGAVRKMMGSPRQLENAVPTSKNPHGVWV